jgi:hypothetical protein
VVLFSIIAAKDIEFLVIESSSVILNLRRLECLVWLLLAILSFPTLGRLLRSQDPLELRLLLGSSWIRTDYRGVEIIGRAVSRVWLQSLLLRLIR